METIFATEIFLGDLKVKQFSLKINEPTCRPAYRSGR